MITLNYKYEFISNSPDDTKEFGIILAKALNPGNVVGLNGELGSGKTVLVKGIAEALGIKDVITSPTFTFLNIYKGEMELYHYDWYRLYSEYDLETTGIDDVFKLKGLVVIEWADKYLSALPDDTEFIAIMYKEDDKRLIKFNNEEIWEKIKN